MVVVIIVLAINFNDLLCDAMTCHKWIGPALKHSVVKASAIGVQNKKQKQKDDNKDCKKPADYFDTSSLPLNVFKTL